MTSSGRRWRPIDAIDYTGVAAGRTFRARVVGPALSRIDGQVVLPAGTDIFLKTTTMPPSAGLQNRAVVKIGLDHAALGGQEIPLASSNSFTQLLTTQTSAMMVKPNTRYAFRVSSNPRQ
jgi:hypothetical protein